MRATTLTAVVFGAMASALALLQAPADSDMFWHLRTGAWILDHGQLLDHDIWSFTKTGTAYNVGSWLGDVVMAVAFRAGSWLGIDVLRAALVGIAAFFASRITLRVQPHVGWAALPIIGTILISHMVWGDRPQLFTLAIFPIVLDVVLATRADGVTRRLWLLPPLFLTWANLHNAFVIGLVAVAIVAIDALLERDARTRRTFAVVTVLCVLATQLNPAGSGAIKRAAAYGALLPSWIVEDRPLDVLSGAGLIFAALLLAGLAAALVRGREGIAARLGTSLLWPGLVVPFVLLALAIQRETPYACMILAPFAAAMVPDALRRLPVKAPVIPRATAVVACVVIAAALVADIALAAPRAADLNAYPTGALGPLAAAHGNLLNEYDWGGFLIEYAPDRPTFIDGRGEALFVPDVLDDFLRVVALEPGYRDVLTRWDISLVLLRPDRPLAAALREDGWRVLGTSDAWVLLSRP